MKLRKLRILVLLTLNLFSSCKSTDKNSALAGTGESYGMECVSTHKKDIQYLPPPVTLIAQAVDFKTYELIDVAAVGKVDGYTEPVFRSDKKLKPLKSSDSEKNIYKVVRKGTSNRFDRTFTLTIPVSAFSADEEFKATLNVQSNSVGPQDDTINMNCEMLTASDLKSKFGEAQ